MTDLTSLFDISKQLAELYRTNLLQDKYRSEGPLVNFTWNVLFNGELFQLQFYLPPEWRWAENGRRPGKFPPPQAMLDFIHVRKIVPKAINGIKPTEKQLAFLFGRKIAREGFQGKHTLERTLKYDGDKIINQLCEEMSKILNREIRGELVTVFDGLKYFDTK